MASTRYRYSDEARKIIRNVHSFCAEEKKNNSLTVPLNRSFQRASSLTGISSATIKRVVSESKRVQPTKRMNTRKFEFDEFDNGVIRRTINNLYIQQKVLPTVRNVMAALRDSIGYTGGKEFLRRHLKHLGFTYKRCKQNRTVLMERSDIVLRRIEYLRRIKALRNAGHCIVYTDETYVHSSHAVNKCWQDDSSGLLIPVSKGERIIILHAGNRNGFIEGASLVFKANSTSGDYHLEMNSKNFTKWLTEKLIPNLPPRSVLVLDNATYHNVQVDRSPTIATKKSDIQDWLRRHDIDFTDSMLKAELLALCNQHKREPVYVVDSILEAHGHQALRLPPYHADLNPIEMIWGIVKGDVARKNLTFKMKDVRTLVDQALHNVSTNNWSKCIDHVIGIEQKYWTLDVAMDDVHPSVIIDLSMDTSSDTDSDTDTATGSSTETASEVD